jgi:hypothetical protein
VSMVATKTTVELLHVQPETSRAQQALRALHHAAGSAGLELTPRESYTGTSDWLLLWGPGAPARADLIRQHVAAGGHAIALDLAYWHRDVKVRVSIDAAHPQRWVMRRDWPRARLYADCPVMRDAWKADGPILIAGIGQKATAQYGADLVAGWEASMRADCQARWPGRPIIERPKPVGLLPTVEGVLHGMGLVITWHSNIAVDAIRLGIPVVCRDGAAAAVCPSELPTEPRPLPVDLRDRFLANLAWFQWAPNESVACWRFLQELIG